MLSLHGSGSSLYGGLTLGRSHPNPARAPDGYRFCSPGRLNAGENR